MCNADAQDNYNLDFIFVTLMLEMCAGINFREVEVISINFCQCYVPSFLMNNSFETGFTRHKSKAPQREGTVSVL